MVPSYIKHSEAVCEVWYLAIFYSGPGGEVFFFFFSFLTGPVQELTGPVSVSLTGPGTVSVS